MNPSGVFEDVSQSFFCSNCGTHLFRETKDGESVLSHGAMPGQEFCPNWGKSFEAPTVALKEKVFAKAEH